MRKVYLLVLFMMCIAASFPVYAKMLSTTCVEVITPVTMHKTNEDLIAAEWMYHPYHFEMYQS